MSTHILTSMFPTGFHDKFVEVLQQKINRRNKFAFIASEFERIHEKTDYYFHFFLLMFAKAGIYFEETYVVDSRMSAEEAQKRVAEADVIWLSGGDTPVQFQYLRKYGLDAVIKQHDGIVIGMSAGSINMAKTSICTLSCGHERLEIYNGLGCVDISVEPHFIRNEIINEVLELSETYTIYGLCDDSFIVCEDNSIQFYGEVYKLSDRKIEQI